MSLDIDRLMRNARVHLPGALDDLLKLELFNVLDGFFKGSNIWQEEITFRTKVGTTDYSIEQTSVASIVRLLWITNSDDIPVTGTMAEPGEIKLRNEPSQIDTYTATVALTVDDPVTRDGYPEFPMWVLAKYGEGVLEGLLGRMMAQPAKPYTNTQMAVFHLKKFTNTVSQAKYEALHKNLNNGQTWRFPQTFATSQRR